VLGRPIESAGRRVGGISRPTVALWLSRYQTEGLAGLIEPIPCRASRTGLHPFARGYPTKLSLTSAIHTRGKSPHAIDGGQYEVTVGTPGTLTPPPCGFGTSTARTGGGSSPPRTSDGGSGTGAVVLIDCRSQSRCGLTVSRGVVLLRGRGLIVAPFPAPARQSVHAVLPHTAYRRRSPPAFGFSRQSLKGLGATTVPDSEISPRWSGDW
jgi:hypothetical protein